MEKECPRCRLTKPIAKFGSRRGESAAQAYCRLCNMEYQKQYYVDNRTTALKKAGDRKIRQRKILTNFLTTYLKDNHCVNCGNDNIVVLEFDHLDPSLKSFSISDAISNGTSLTRLMKELRKCQVLCRNCHGIKTQQDQGSWRMDV